MLKGKSPKDAGEPKHNGGCDNEMNHQRKRLSERLDEQPRGNIRDDHHWNDPAEDYAEQSRENCVRITRNIQKIKIAVDQSLSAHDPETDRGQAKHY